MNVINACQDLEAAIALVPGPCELSPSCLFYNVLAREHGYN